MIILCLTGLVLLIAGFFYAPKSLFKAKSKSILLKRLEQFKKYESILGAVAIVLGLALVGLFFYYITKEMQLIAILVVSFVSVFLGIVFAANKIKSLFKNDILNKFIQVIEDLDKTLKQNFSPKLISVFLFILGFVGILSALFFDF